MSTIFLENSIDAILMKRVSRTSEFFEFCNDIDRFDKMWEEENEFFIEEVIDPKSKFHKNVGKTLKNTWDTTTGVVNTYSDLTDIGGAIYSGAYKVTMSAVNLAARMLKFLVRHIMRIPDLIVSIINGIGDIPQNIKVKIRGDIKLYITAGDLQLLFEKRLVYKLDDYLNQLELLTKGDMWSTFFHRNVTLKMKKPESTSDGINIKLPKLEISKNEMEICRSLERKFQSINNLTFKETVIDLSDDNNVETYFGNENQFTIMGIDGKQHEVTYYGALKLLAENLNAHKELIQELSVDLGQKFTESQLNESFANCHAMARNRIITTIQNVSKISSVISNLCRYILIDMRTIEDSIKKIQKKKDIETESDATANAKNRTKTKVTKKKKIREYY